VNALYDLGTHDISIFNYLLGATPVAVSGHGSCISQEKIEDVCFATLEYPDGTLGHIHVSWLNPRKVRTLTVVGDRKMAHWDDVDPADTLRVYDKRLEELPYYDSFGEFQFLIHNADVHLPKIDHVEPLVNQANAFLDIVLEGAPCRSGGPEAEAVVGVLEAATRSLRTGGGRCAVSPSNSREPHALTQQPYAAHSKHTAAVIPGRTADRAAFDKASEQPACSPNGDAIPRKLHEADLPSMAD
jgi:predicted dehydrogenase